MKGWLLALVTCLFLCHEAFCTFQHCNDRMIHVENPTDSKGKELLMDSLNHHYVGIKGGYVAVVKHLTSSEFTDNKNHKTRDHYFKFQLNNCHISMCIRVEHVDTEQRYYDEYELPDNCQLTKREEKGSDQQREHALGSHTKRAMRALRSFIKSKQPKSLTHCTHPECKAKQVVETVVQDPTDSTTEARIIRDIHWDKSQKFTSTCAVSKNFALWINNPTSERVELQISAALKQTGSADRIPVVETHKLEPFTHKELEHLKLEDVKFEVLAPGRAKIMELRYYYHSVILVALEPQPHVSWYPTELVIGHYEDNRNNLSPYYEAVKKAYHERAVRMKAGLGGSLSQDTAIPKIIHWVWLGGELSKISTRMMHSVYLHHHERGWEFRLWIDHKDEESLGDVFWSVFKGLKRFTVHKVTEFELVSTPFYLHIRAAKHFAMCSDIIRLSALHKYGGIYMDHDVAAVASIDTLASTFGFFAPQLLVNGYPEINNDVLGTRKGHVCIEALYAQLSSNVKSEQAISKMPKVSLLLRNFIFETTGPTLVKSVVMKLLPENDDMIVLPPSYLHGNSGYIKHFIEVSEGGSNNFAGIFPETITFTFLAGKWTG